MSRLLLVFFVINAVIPAKALTQAAQPSAAECEALGKYRDIGLYAEWSSVVGKSSAYAEAMNALDEVHADLQSTKDRLQLADLIGSFAHMAGTLSTLTLNLTGVRYKALERTVVSELTDGKFAIDFFHSSQREQILAAAQYANDIAVSASGVGRGAIAARDLALDLKSWTGDLAESESIRRQLNQQMSNLHRDAEQLQSKIVTIDAALASLSGLKSEIDQACGIRGCPISGSATVSRKGALVCLVSNQASCPGCKDGWRHRCDATPTGLAWRPMDKCLPNELRNARAGTDHQQTAAELFAAQSDAFASELTDEQKVERRRKIAADASKMADAANKGAAQAAERNAYFAAQTNALHAEPTKNDISGCAVDSVTGYCIDSGFDFWKATHVLPKTNCAATNSCNATSNIPIQGSH